MLQILHLLNASLFYKLRFCYSTQKYILTLQLFLLKCTPQIERNLSLKSLITLRLAVSVALKIRTS